jgi:small subunit ribosomal protein S18
MSALPHSTRNKAIVAILYARQGVHGQKTLAHTTIDAARLRSYFDGLIGGYFQNRCTRSVSMVRKKLGRGRKNRCRFCTKEGCPRPAFVDYKDVQGLKKMCTSQGKLFSRKRSGNCAAFQRAVKDAIKRARFMALMPYVGE